jgi:ABC-2 type transport system permease protein
MKNELIYKEMHRSYSQTITKFLGLIRWSLVRHKYLIPTFSLVQIILAIAIVCGLAFLIPQIDADTTVFLSSGAMTIGIISVGCVLAPQIVSESKQNGLFEYQRTLPVARSSILVADIVIWSLAALPGVIASCITTILRFKIKLHITPLSISIILLILVTLICIGFSIAYWLPPNIMALATQVIMIGNLLFSPITYPAERLPEWASHIYQLLPFVPASNLIRSVLFQAESFSMRNLCTVLIWAVIAFVSAMAALERRD